MNVSYRWLQALLPEFGLSPEETAEVLALRGAPVEELLPLATAMEGMAVARVKAVTPHPSADRLSVCEVEWGGDVVQVVCGAPNVEVGGYYPFAPVGTVLPTGLEISKVAIRGVDSEGMLCSEAELDLGPDADGIMALDGDFFPGQSLTEALGLDDWRLDVEVTPNRGDLLSHAGVARELAPAGREAIQLPPIPAGTAPSLSLLTSEDEVSAGGVTIGIQDPDLCFRYLGAVIRGVKVGPSPVWLASRLRAAGSRPINNVVDATNYVLLELGQPLHAFDLDKLGGSAIVVRAAREGELLRTLDGENRRLSKGMLAICDETDPVAIAGVMGGQDSEVSGETTDVLLECALFDPKSVRATRNALGMSTDASFRFERGVDPEGMERAVRRAVEVILATSGGEPDPEILDVCPRPWLGLKVPLRPSRVEHVLGISLSSEEIADLLKPLGFEVVQASPDTLDVAVPGFRSYDVVREVDLVEEVARTYGYDRFPSDMGPFRPGTVPDHALFHLEDELRNLLVGEGFLEAQTMAFVSQEYGEVELSNPVSAEEGFLRAALLPGLLRRVEYNFARGGKDLRLFEIGTVFFDRGPDLSPAEETRLALVLTGGRAPLHWEGEGEPVDVWDLKGLLARLVPAARLKSAVVQEGFSDHGELVPGERFAVYGEGEALLGRAGRVDPITVDAPAWAGPVWGLELVLPADPEPAPVPVHEPPPAFPGVDRDLALVLPKALPARQVEDVIRSASGPLMVDLQIFDLFEGAGIPEGMRSVAFRLRFQSRERTLTDEDVERSVARVADRLREELGVETRG